MKKNHQKLSFFLFVALLLTIVFLPIKKSEGISGENLFRSFFNGKLPTGKLQEAIKDWINVQKNSVSQEIAPSLQQAEKLVDTVKDFSEIKSPEDFIQTLTNISPQAGNALNHVYTGVTGVVNQFQTVQQQITSQQPSTQSSSQPSSQPSTQPSTPAAPSWAEFHQIDTQSVSSQQQQQQQQQQQTSQPSAPAAPSWAAFQQLSNQSMTTPTTKKPTTTNQPSTPTTPSWAAFQQLSNQSMTTPTTKRPTTTTKKADNKVSRYFCDQTTGQCKYSVYTDLSTYSKPPYYRTISECQSNCKKSSYVCYKYSPGSSCQGDKCQPYASDTPCQSTCTPGGAPLTGTAQQTQTGGSSGQTCRYRDCRGNVCSIRELNQSVCPADRCKTNADCGGTSSGGGTSIPSSSSQSQQTQQTSSGGSCQRQEGRCSTVDNCLKCPSGYYKQSGGCGGCPGKGYDCYILCCPRK